MYGHAYFGGGYWGPQYWGPAAAGVEAPHRVGSSVAVGRRQRLIRALLAEEEERSLLDMMRRQGMEQLQLAVNFRRLQNEVFKQQLVDQQIEQARTAITTIFFGEL